MVFDVHATIRYKHGTLNSRLLFEKGWLTLDIDGYILQTNPALTQPWEISEESFRTAGNPYGFYLTGYDEYEITNFELEFRFPSFVIKNGAEHETELTILIKYEGMDQEIGLFDRDKHIAVHVQGDMEALFRQLYNTPDVSTHYLKSCFACALSGYEKGGSTMFCMKQSKALLLSKPYLEHYQNSFAGLKAEVVPEFHHCSEFEMGSEKK